MDNHVHLFIAESEEIGESIKRITVGYVQWHNNKYGRTGHLFQNRYKSEVVETESYFITVLRYIHQNPVKAKIVNRAAEYRWSSYNEYILEYRGKNTSMDAELIKTYYRKQKDYEEYVNKVNNDECLEYKIKKKYTDNNLRSIINKEFKISTSEMTKLTVEERARIIKNIYKDITTSVRQLSRVFGIGKSIIEKVIK